MCERRFCKKIFGAGRDSAGSALASVLRKHSTEGRTPDAVERCVRHCARSHPPRETGTCRPDSKRVERIASGSVATPISLVGHLLDPAHGFELLADVLGITIELSIGCALWRAGRRSRSLATEAKLVLWDIRLDQCASRRSCKLSHKAALPLRCSG